MKYLATTILACLMLSGILAGTARATHIVGGEITYRCLGIAPGGMNRYEVTLNVYRSCSPTSFGFDQTVYLAVYDAVTLARIDTIDIELGATDTLPITADDTCFIPPGDICYEHTAYVKEILLPNSANGYFLSWARCCRNGTILNIVNPLSTGMTYVANIPATMLCNNSPTFDNQPPTYICLDEPFIFDHGATDPDGDSLVYALTDPYEGGGQGNPVPDPPPPPYNPVTWQAPFSLSNILGGNPVMNIDPTTGLLTASPDQPGQFVFSVSVYEYRDAVLISEVKRDYQLNVMSCPRNNPPQIVTPSGPNVIGDTLIFITGQDNCFPITILDQNSGTGIDSVVINGEGDIFGGGAFPGPFATLADSGLSPLTTDICWHPLCHQAGTVHQVLLPARDNWDCPEPHQVFDTLYAKVVPATPEPPEVRCVSVDDPTSISITWINPPATRLDGFHSYVIERNDGGTWTTVGTISDSLQNTFTDLSVTNADSIRYCYRISTAKDCPNHLQGPPGNTACSIVPNILKVNQVQSDISWNAYTVWPDPEYTLIGDSTGPVFTVAQDLLDTNYLYTACELDATFRIMTTDPLTGCEVWSGWSERAVHEDSVPGLITLCRVSVEENDRSVALEWEFPGDNDLLEWRIYRSEGGLPYWGQVASGQDFSLRSYTDAGLDCDTYSYCYQIEVEDICGNISLSETACTILLDIDAEDYTAYLDWTPYIGWDTLLEKYEIFLDRYEGSGEKSIAFTDSSARQFVDDEIEEELPEYCYRVRAHEDPQGCGRHSQSNEVCVSYPPTLFFPNAFSPNDDGLNDFFQHPNLFLDDFHIEIFDRWGKLIFESFDQKRYWDGTYRGDPVSEGVYVFVARGTGLNGKALRKQGTVTVIR